MGRPATTPGNALSLMLARTPFPRKLLKALGGLLFASALWGAGFLWFLEQIPNEQTENPQADSAVILTGGKERLKQGLDLLQKKRVGKLFVSGVSQGIDARKLLALGHVPPTENLLCCIDIGYLATNTQENAQETKNWKGLQKTLLIVTAAYHMPRAALEFQASLPHITLIPYPVFTDNFPLHHWPKQWRAQKLALAEYHKYLLAYVRMLYSK